MATIVGDDNPNSYQGGSFEDSLSGMGGNDTLEGFGGNDTLDGGTGNDDLWGGTGNDTIYGGDGNDRLIADVDLVGAVNYLDGGADNDELRGGAGNDTLIGGSGNDTIHTFDGGTDLVQCGDGDDLVSLFGPAQATVQGGSGNDRFFMSGLQYASVVTFTGGTGSDTYVADYEPPNQNWSSSLLRVQDFHAGAGGDRIDLSTIPTYGLVGSDDPFDPRLGYLRLVQQGADTAIQADADGLNGTTYGWHTVLLLKNVDASELTLADNFVNATNVTALTVVQDTSAAPTVAAPIADLTARPGVAINFKVPNGTFVDANVGDQVRLSATLANGDPLPSWLTFNNWTQIFTGTPPAGTPLVPLSIRVTATDVSGRSVSDVFAITPASTGSDSLVGSSGNDVYDGLAGNDTIDGAGGNDSLLGGTGDDLLLGNAGNDTLLGGSGNDRLDGGTGNDSLVGGAGSDTYVVDAAGDVVNETGTLAGEIDTVLSSVSHTLGANLERLTLTGTTVTNGAGNTLANTLVGNDAANRLSGLDGNDTLTGGLGNDSLLGGNGNDLLNGGAGNDSMTGGLGNDTYVVGSAGDAVVEAAGGGIDLVQSAITYRLGAEVENLTLTGALAIDGTGNVLANRLTGNAAANLLTGGAGDDVINGQAGNDQLVGGIGSDTLTGGAGNDLFVFNSKVGTDRVSDFSSADDTFRISMAGIKVGDGDLLVEGGAVDANPGFAKASELVVFTTNIAGSIDAAKAAATIGSAGSAFSAGDTRLFVVDNGTQSALYLFTSSGADAAVSAAELTQLALVSGTTTTLSDYVFVA